MKQYTVEFYSTKKPLFRRQYHWRIRHSNGNIIARSSEGYNNRLDRDMTLKHILAAIRVEDFQIKVLDK